MASRLPACLPLLPFPSLSQSALFPIRGVCILNVSAAAVPVATVPLLQPPPCPFPSQTLEQEHRFTVAGQIPDVLGGSKLS